MPTLPPSLLSYLRVVTGAWQHDLREDAELLARFAENGDEAAFKALVCRHGPLVWRSCTRVLGNGLDAEDAFQTVFMALARQAGRLRREPLAAWLYRVARRTALKVDVEVRRRQSLERHLPTAMPAEATAIDRSELYAALDEELAGLPERLRVPLLLHYLEGKTQVEVARILGCGRSVLQRRLARGEAILRKQLERRGIAVSVGTVAALLASSVTVSAVPALLIGSTARAAMAFRSGAMTGRAVEAARAVLGALPSSSLETTMVRKSLWIMLACVGFLGVGLVVWGASSARPDAVESLESSALPKEAAGPGNGRVDRFGDPLPSGALARLGTSRLRHTGNLINREGAESVVFSQDGKVLITVGRANPIRLWDTATGKLLRSFGDSRQPWAPSFVLSPKGDILAASNVISISLWEVATGKLLRQLEDASGVGALAFSRDGRTLLSGGGNHIRVWEVATGKVVRDQLPKDGHVFTPDMFSSNGNILASFSPDGKILAGFRAVADRNHVVCLWEVATGKDLRHLTLESRERNPLGTLAFSPDSRFLAVSSITESVNRSSAVHLWEVATGKEVRKWTPDQTETYSIAFSPDGKVLATGSGFGPIHLWETATGKQLRQCQDYLGHTVALAFSPDGSTLASLTGKHDHTARLWEVASGKERLPTSPGHVGPVLSVAFSSEGKNVISGGRDGLVGFWNAETGQEQRPPIRAGDFQTLAAFSPDGKTFLTVGNSFSPKLLNRNEVILKTPTLICVWDRATGQKLREFQGPEGAPQSLALTPDGKILILTYVNRVYLMEVTTGKGMRSITNNLGVFAALFSDGKTLAVAQGRSAVHFYAIATGNSLGGDIGVVDWDNVRCFALSPDGQTLAIGGEDGILKGGGVKYKIGLWRAQTYKGLWRAQTYKKDWKETGRLVGHQDIVWGLTFSPDGKTLASASKDGTVRLWEVATGKERRRFVGHGGEVWCVAFAPDGRRLAAGSNDTTILVWDVTGRLQNSQLRPVKLSAQEVKSLWADLAGADAVRAGQAVWTLVAAPAQALPLLREHLRPVAPTGPRIVRLIANLDSDDFAVREKATDELKELGEVAEPALRQAWAKPASLEMRRRLEQLLERLEVKFPLSGEKLRSHRAVEVLGQIGTPEALLLLEALAQGAPGARLTREAQTVLQYLRTRVNVIKP